MTVEEIIEKNLKLMRSSKKGGMLSLYESIGGNAGTWRGYGCWAARFFHDDFGEMYYFGNTPQVPKEIEEKYMEGIFRIAKRIDLCTNLYSDRIIRVFVAKKERFAGAVLTMTADKFNERYGFAID